MQNLPPPRHAPDYTTFAQVKSEIVSRNPFYFSGPLAILGRFWNRQENMPLLREQLDTLKNQGVSVLKFFAKYKQDGGDPSQALPVFESLFENVIDQLIPFAAGLKWKAIFDPNILRPLELTIASASESLAAQLRDLTEEGDIMLAIYKEELEQAREKDSTKIERLKEVTKRFLTSHLLKDAVASSMQELVRAIRDAGIGQERIDAKLKLAVLTEITGQSLPPCTVLDGEFVAIGEETINQGSAYITLKGEYFTGREIAVKVLLHPVDSDTAKRRHEELSAIKLSALRHDSIHPVYGVGFSPSPLADGKFRLYMVSPYLPAQDVRQYLRKHSDISATSRLHMVFDVARGLTYLHSGSGLTDGQGLAHGSLSITKVLVKNSGSVVISGFEKAKLIGGRNELVCENPGLQNLESVVNGAAVAYGADILAWALLALEIMTDKRPFGEETSNMKASQMIAANRKVRRIDHPKIEEYKRKDEIWQLLDDCYKAAAQDRPTASEVSQRLYLIIASCESVLRDERLKDPPISSDMTRGEVVRLLLRHGCLDVSMNIRYDGCSGIPYTNGGFGDVYVGYLYDGAKVAIKCARTNVCDENHGHVRDGAFKSVAKEIYTSSKHRHENVLNFLGLAYFREQIALVSPWMDNGTVMDYISLHPEADRCNICKQVAAGVAYLHREKSVHGDLKGNNVLISKDGVPQITDFGTSVLEQYTLGFTNPNTVRQFSLRWAAPELFDDEARLSPQADVYALGMTVLEIITGKKPYERIRGELGVFKSIASGIAPQRPTEDIPETSRSGDILWKLLQTCWKTNPMDRTTAAHVESVMASITPTSLRTTSSANSVIESPYPTVEVREETTKSLGRDKAFLSQPLVLESLGVFTRYFLVMAQSCV